MIGWIVKKVIGTKNQREVRRMQPMVARINELEKQCQQLSDEQLRAKTDEFKARIEKGRRELGYQSFLEEAAIHQSEGRGDEAKAARKKASQLEQEILNELLPEAFA